MYCKAGSTAKVSVHSHVFHSAQGSGRVAADTIEHAGGYNGEVKKGYLGYS
jgi:hypothetical protein